MTRLDWLTVAMLGAVALGATLLIARGHTAPPARVPAPRALSTCVAIATVATADTIYYEVAQPRRTPCRVTLPMDARRPQP